MANLCLPFWALECNTQWWPVRKPDTNPMRSYFMHSLMIGDKPTRQTTQMDHGSWNWRQIACKWVTSQRLNYKLDHSDAVTSARHQGERDREREIIIIREDKNIRACAAHFRFSPASDPALWSHTQTVGHPAVLGIATSSSRSWNWGRSVTRWVAAWPDRSFAHYTCHTAWPNCDADTRPPVYSIPRRHFDHKLRSQLSWHVVPHWRVADIVHQQLHFQRWYRPSAGYWVIVVL